MTTMGHHGWKPPNRMTTNFDGVENARVPICFVRCIQGVGFRVVHNLVGTSMNNHQ